MLDYKSNEYVKTNFCESMYQQYLVCILDLHPSNELQLGRNQSWIALCKSPPPILMKYLISIIGIHESIYVYITIYVVLNSVQRS